MNKQSDKRANSSKNTTNWGGTITSIIAIICVTLITNQLIASGKEINWTNIIIIGIIGFCSTKATKIAVNGKGKVSKKDVWKVGKLMEHTSTVIKGEDEKPQITKKPQKKPVQAPQQENTPQEPEIEVPKRKRGRPRKDATIAK